MDPTQLQPGYRLDRYELLCPLAYGGMASVWLARFGGRLGFERMVVIKMILPQYSQDPRFQEMFLDEAQIASKIEHQNVARILDVGEHQDNYFIVMEWVDGDSLSKILRAAEQRKQPISPGVALRIVADAAAGLHAAHELKDRDGTPLGVVHRDVSPQNILVANSGATMIIDFGVAKARDRVSQETSAGQLKGKIRYMAPEQALGKNIDHRADVWALGAMLYEMFTGNPPYDGPNEVATLHKLTSGERPPTMPLTMPAALRAVVDRALGYEPEMRYASALELNLALESAMLEINEPTTVASVAAYTGELLSERKAARRKAVDAALDAARRRDTGQPAPATALSIGPLSAAALSLPPTPSSTRLLFQPVHEVPSTPSGALGLSETPSAASAASAASATLGSANMEYLSEQPAPFEPRRRRYIAAAALGVSVAAGVIGAMLIISATVLKHDATSSSSSRASATAASNGHAPPPPVESAESPTPSASEQPSATTPSAATAVPSAAPAETPPPALRNDSPPPRPPVGVHKAPPVVATPPVKPLRPPAPSSTKVDRGF